MLALSQVISLDALIDCIIVIFYFTTFAKC